VEISRSNRKSEIIQAMTSSKKVLLSTIAKYGFEILQESMKGLADDIYNGAKLTPSDIIKVAGVITEMDKIIRLDDGGFESDEFQINEKHNIKTDLHADSLDVIELIMFFERDYTIAINDDEVELIQTVEDLINTIHLKTGAH